MEDIRGNGIVYVVAIISLLASHIMLGDTNAHGDVNAYPRSAEEAITGALANVRSRYQAKLSRYGLTESYFDETIGICDLMLLDVNSWTKYQIVYYRTTDQIEWPSTMPKTIAKDLIQDRLIIHAYECSLGMKNKKEVDPGKEAEVKQKRAERHTRRNQLGETASEEDVRAAFKGRYGKWEAQYFMNLRKRKQNGEILDEKDERNYEQMRQHVGKYKDIYGSDFSPSSPRRPRSNRRQNDEEKERIRNAAIKSRQSVGKYANKERIPSMWGQRLLDKRSKEKGRRMPLSLGTGGKLSLEPGR